MDRDGPAKALMENEDGGVEQHEQEQAGLAAVENTARAEEGKEKGEKEEEEEGKGKEKEEKEREEGKDEEAEAHALPTTNGQSPSTPSGTPLGTEAPKEPPPPPLDRAPDGTATPGSDGKPSSASRRGSKDMTSPAKHTHLACSRFVYRALKTMLPHARRHTTFREAANELLEMGEDGAEGLHKYSFLPHPAFPMQAYMRVLQLACATMDGKVVSVALDCYQKLMAFGTVTDALPGTMPESVFLKKATRVLGVESNAAPFTAAAGASSSSTNPLEDPKKVGLLSESVAVISDCLSVQNDQCHLQMLKALLSAITVCDAHGWTLRLAVSTIFSITVRATATVNIAPSRTTLTQAINCVFHRLEAASRILRRKEAAHVEEDCPTPPEEPPLPPEDRKSPDRLTSITGQEVVVDPATGLTTQHSDGAHVFILLCQIAQSVEVSESAQHETVEMKALTSSLDLIHKLLQSCGQGFRETTPFLSQLRDPLLAALLKCCVSPIPSIFQTSLNIFVGLLFSFKHHFKHEIGILITNVVLKVLESAVTSFDQRSLVLQSLCKITGSPQVLLDIFINYDCDVTSERVFERMMNSVSRIVQSPHQEANWLTPKQESILKTLGIQTLVTVLRSMLQWMVRFNPPKPCKASEDYDGDATPVPIHIPVASPQIHGRGAAIGEVEKKRKLRMQLEEAAGLFNTKPKKGVAYSIQHGLCENSPAGIAAFLSANDILDRSMVGEYIGEPDELNVAVLMAYCELTDMAGMALDEAIRQFLAKFKLPKEGQKIERIMEHFSNAYYQANPNNTVFKTAEAVFVVAVGMLMLNTDLHHPQVERKMPKEKFVSQFRGVNDGENIEAVHLETLYDSIARNPMMDVKLAEALQDAKEAAESAGFFSYGGGLFTTKRERKTLAYTAEGQRMMSQTRELISMKKSAEYYFATDVEHVKPMFGVCWTVMLAAFSMQLEADPPAEVARMCIEGLQLGIHIASVFELHTEREAFVRTLCGMAHLRSAGRKLIGPKNIACIKSILKIAVSEGDHLGASWLSVLECLSEIDRLRILGLTRKHHTTNVQHAQQQQRPAKTKGQQPQPLLNEELINAAEVTENIDEHLLFKVYANSTQLSPVGLKEFVKHLCQVAIAEVTGTQARMYSLEKLVEVAADNMGPRLLSVWTSISQLLVKIGVNPSTNIAEFGVDSLRQLVMKCLERDELLQCRLQPELVQPFGEIMASTLPTKHVRDLVLRCLMQLTLVRHKNLGPGWPELLRALMKGVVHHHEQAVVDMVAGILHRCISEEVLPDVLPYLEDMVHCMTFLAGNGATSPHVAKEFIGVLAKFPGCVAAVDPSCESEAWCFVLQSAVFMFTDPDKELRNHAVTAFSSALVEAGDRLPSEVWHLLSEKVIVASSVLPVLYPSTLTGKEAFPHFHALSLSGSLDRATADEFAASTLPLVIAQFVAGPFRQLSHLSSAAEIVQHPVAVLCKVIRSMTAKELMSVAAKELWELVVAFQKSMTDTQRNAIGVHLSVLLDASLIRRSLLEPFSTLRTDELQRHEDDESSAPALLSLYIPVEQTDDHDLRQRIGIIRLGSGLRLNQHSPKTTPSESPCTPNLSDDMPKEEAEGEMLRKLPFVDDDNTPRFFEQSALMVKEIAMRSSRLLVVLPVIEKLFFDPNVNDEWRDAFLPPNLYHTVLENLLRCALSHAFLLSSPMSSWRASFSHLAPILPSVSTTGTSAYSLYFRILFSRFTNPDSPLRDHARSMLPNKVCELFRMYTDEGSQQSGDRCGKDALSMVVCTVLQLTTQLDKRDFAELVPHFHKALCGCIRCGDAPVLHELSLYFEREWTERSAEPSSEQ